MSLHSLRLHVPCPACPGGEERQLARALPREVAAWWQRREQSNVASTADGNWQLRGPASEDGRLAWVTVDDADLVKFAAIDQLFAPEKTAARFEQKGVE